MMHSNLGIQGADKCRIGVSASKTHTTRRPLSLTREGDGYVIHVAKLSVPRIRKSRSKNWNKSDMNDPCSNYATPGSLSKGLWFIADHSRALSPTFFS